MNENLPRWIKASIAKHFESLSGITLYVEGEDLPTGDRVELRTSGVEITGLDSTTSKCFVEIFCDIIFAKDNDTHKQQRLEGKVAALFTSVITIKKYGDDDSFVDCLQLVGRVNINSLGQVDVATREMQSLVYASYQTILEN